MNEVLILHLGHGDDNLWNKLVDLLDENGYQINHIERENKTLGWIKFDGLEIRPVVDQTIHFIDRHKQHYNGTEEKFNTADFDKVIVIFSVHFNRSALDDVESQFITYFTAGNSKKSSQLVAFDQDEVINRTSTAKINYSLY